MVEEGIQQQHICTDCGASPHDARHLFAYNAHPIDLWNRFVRSASSTTGTLTDLTTDLIMATMQTYMNAGQFPDIKTRHIELISYKQNKVRSEGGIAESCYFLPKKLMDQ